MPARRDPRRRPSSSSKLRTLALPAILLIALIAPFTLPAAHAEAAAADEAEKGDAPAAPQVLKLSLKQCAELALRYNPRVREAALDVTDRERLLDSARAAWLPTLSGGAMMRREVIGEPFAFNDPRGRFTNTGPAFDAGVRGVAPLGTTYSVNAKSELLWTTRNAESISPQYRNRLGVELTQPLLRGWGVPTALAAQRAAELEHQASHGSARGVGDDLLLELTRAYWELYIQFDMLNLQRGGLDYFQKQIDRARSNRPRNAEGIVRAYELLTANQHNVMAYTVRSILSGERQLLALIYLTDGGKRASVPLDQRLIPTDHPEPQPETRSLEALIARAYAKRPEVRAAGEKLRAQELLVAAEGNRARPALDLVLNAGLASFTGEATRGQARHNLVTNLPHPDISGLYGDAWSQVFSGRMPYVEAGLRFDLPLAADTRSNTLRAVAIERDRLRVKLWALKSRVALEVRDAFMRLQQQARLLEIARQTFDTVVKRKDKALEDVFAGRTDVGEVQWAENFTGKFIGGSSWAAKDYMIVRAELARALGELRSQLGVK
ncbi:MAG: TolC family protein [Proteobacteria bacterium]|nr:TolC family protein [Pseudomonadota bacterium]